MEEVKDLMALHGAGSFGRQVNVQVRKEAAGCVTGLINLALVGVGIILLILLVVAIAGLSHSGNSANYRTSVAPTPAPGQGNSTDSTGSTYSTPAIHSTPSAEVQSTATPQGVVRDGRAVPDEDGNKKGLSWDDHGRHFDLIPDTGEVDLFIDNQFEKRFTGKGAAVIYVDHTYGSQAGKPIAAPRAEPVAPRAELVRRAPNQSD